MKLIFSVFLVIPLVEVIITIYLAQNVGSIWALLLALIGTTVAATEIVYNHTLGIRNAMHDKGKPSPLEQSHEAFSELLVSTAVTYLLLIPGLITDVVAILLLLPVTRRKVILKMVLAGEQKTREREAREKEAKEAAI